MIVNSVLTLYLVDTRDYIYVRVTHELSLQHGRTCRYRPRAHVLDVLGKLVLVLVLG